MLRALNYINMCNFQTEYASYNPSLGRYEYKITRSPMCEYMVKFLHELKKLQFQAQMNSVLENFTILQVGNFLPLPE